MQLHLQNDEETHRNQSFRGVAAVGSAGPILNLLLVLFVGISIGAGIMVSQYFGARQREELSLSIGWCDSYLKILFRRLYRLCLLQHPERRPARPRGLRLRADLPCRGDAA